MGDRILLLVEGKDELTYFKRLGQIAFGEKEGTEKLEIVALRCNIYSLYKTMEQYDFDIDIEKAIRSSPNCSPEDRKKIASYRFPYKYLIFDFDFQENSMGETEKLNAIQKMIERFDNETENGKLLINYPMFESIREKYELGDFESITFDPSSKTSYKNAIEQRGNKIDFDKLSRQGFLKLAELSLCMSNFIIYGVFEKGKEQRDDLTEAVFKKQQSKIQNENLVYCLNTSVQLPCIYFGLKMLK